MPCDADSYCDEGVCKPRPCRAGESFCEDNAIAYCEGNGPFRRGDSCDSEGVCVAEGGKASCHAWWCEPGSAACIANQSGECAADGQSLASVASDCSALSQICDVRGQCAASVVDTLGADGVDGIFTADAIYANDLEVFSSRQLIEIEVMLSLYPARDLVWQVYELDPETWVPSLHCQATSFAEAQQRGAVSSGPLSCALEAGRRYAVAIQDTAPPDASGDIFWGPSPVAGAVRTSFAHWIGSNLVDLLDPSQPLRLEPERRDPFVMKLTTALP